MPVTRRAKAKSSSLLLATKASAAKAQASPKSQLQGTMASPPVPVGEIESTSTVPPPPSDSGTSPTPSVGPNASPTKAAAIVIPTIAGARQPAATIVATAAAKDSTAPRSNTLEAPSPSPPGDHKESTAGSISSACTVAKASPTVDGTGGVSTIGFKSLVANATGLDASSIAATTPVTALAKDAATSIPVVTDAAAPTTIACEAIAATNLGRDATSREAPAAKASSTVGAPAKNPYMDAKNNLAKSSQQNIGKPIAKPTSVEPGTNTDEDLAPATV